MPKSVDRKRDKSKRFRYGNYDRYYQYRNVGRIPDVRMSVMQADWFQGKEVLDIGCNVGRLTIAIAKSFKPKAVIGIDIDDELIQEAKVNVRRDVAYTTASTSLSSTASASPDPSHPDSSPLFPSNIFFATANYVLPNDDLLSSVEEEYDTILCMSVTKWIHLNWGDEGLQRVFKRIHRQLRPGGRLILEPQPWSSYVKKHSVSEETDANFRKITFRPEKFTDYLLSEDVGFRTCGLVDVPHNESKGFRRPVYCFTKSSET